MSQQQRRQEPPWFNTLCLLQTQLRQLIQHQGEHQQPVSFKQEMLNDLKYQESLLQRGLLSNRQLQLEVEYQVRIREVEARAQQAQDQQRLQYEQQQQGLQDNEEQQRKLGQELLLIHQRQHELNEQQEFVIETKICKCGKEYVKATNKRMVTRMNKCRECTRRYNISAQSRYNERKLRKNNQA